MGGGTTQAITGGISKNNILTEYINIDAYYLPGNGIIVLHTLFHIPHTIILKSRLLGFLFYK